MTVISDSWSNLHDVILFGYGRQGFKVVNTLRRDFNILAIVDNDKTKQGQSCDGIPVIGLADAEELIKKNKIIVTTIERNYRIISEQLKKIGLVEYDDYIMYQDFILEWYYRFRNKLFVPKTDIPVTSLCTMRCENCHIFVPYWKKNENYDLNTIIKTIDNYFNYVDFVADIDILGGEPFLYPDLDKVIEHIGTKYRHKIGYIGLISNGTVIPSKKVLNLMREFSVVVSISDYSDVIGKKSKIGEICYLLEKEKIEYIINRNITWYYFGRPDDEYKYTGDSAKIHFNDCNTIYRVIYNNKFFCCGTAWAAEMSGLFKSNNTGYVELDTYNERVKEDIFSICKGKIDNGYLDFCQVCGGFGEDNKRIVETARQING